MRTPFKERATPAVLTFLRDAKVGEVVSLTAMRGRRGIEASPL